jgi:hypothetical protein
MSPGNIFTKRVEFKEYTVGQPNNITVDLMLDKLELFDQFEKRLNWRHTYVHLICENDKYPGRITLDNKILLRKQKYTFADLNGILPKGISINRNIHKDLNESIVNSVNFKNKTVVDSITSTEVFEELIWEEKEIEEEVEEDLGKEGFFRTADAESEDPFLGQTHKIKKEDGGDTVKDKSEIGSKSFKKQMKKEGEEFRKRIQEEMGITSSDSKKK